MENLKFKILELSDITRIMEIEKKSFAESTWEDATVYTERISVFSKGNLGIWHKGNLVAFICSEIWDYEESYENNRFGLSHNIEDYHIINGTELYVSSFAVDADYRSKGLGGDVFQEFMRIMKQEYSFLNSCILLVSEEWINAIKIYEKFGFVTIEKINDAFQNDYDKSFTGLIMRKSFDKLEE